MRVSRIVILSLIVTVALLAAPAEAMAAARQNGGGLQWTSPHTQSATPIPSTPAPSYVAPSYAAPNDTTPEPYAPGYFSQPAPAQNTVSGPGGHLPGGPYGVPGSPYYYTPQSYDPARAGYGGGDPYTFHFGPGFYRSYEYGHNRFPYYSYRRPWYFPGHTSYNRDTNMPW